MAAEEETGRRSIAEKLQGHWGAAAGWEQMTWGAVTVCRRGAVLLRRRY